jgi:hypothetical protein
MLSNFRSAKMIIKTNNKYFVGKNLNKLHLLGGKRENNESPFQNLQREVLEESSYVINLKKSNSVLYYFKIFDKLIYLHLDNIVFDEKYKCYFFIFSTNDLTDSILTDISKLIEINQYLLLTKLIYIINLDIVFIQAYYFLEKYMKTRKKDYLFSLLQLYKKNNIIFKNKYLNEINNLCPYLEMENLITASKSYLITNLRENNILDYL